MKDPSKTPTQVVGLDLGDRYGYAVILERDREDVVEEFRVRMSDKGLRQAFAQRCASLIAIEVGTHSRWVSRLLRDLGHRVLVANPRKVHLISKNRRKDDRIDAKILARLARADPQLLSPVTHRGESFHLDLAVIRARDALVRSRTKLINHCRGQVKTTGQRLPACDTRSFARKMPAHLPEPLRPALEPLLEQITSLTDQISVFDRQIEDLAHSRYPETELLTQVSGVGALTALTYVLTLEDPRRFRDSRQVAAYLGLVPGRHDSGQTKRAGRITKEGDKMLRRLLVQSAHYVLGPSVQSVSCASMARNSSSGEDATQRRKPASPSPASLPDCSITSGSMERSTIPGTTRLAPRRSQRRPTRHETPSWAAIRPQPPSPGDCERPSGLRDRARDSSTPLEAPQPAPSSIELLEECEWKPAERGSLPLNLSRSNHAVKP